MKTQELAVAIENLIDGATLRDVVSALATICDEKAEHVQSCWQDRNLAREWQRWANKFATMADDVDC